MKSPWLLKFTMHELWNQGEVFPVVMTYEYKDRQSFEANRTYLDDTFDKNQEFQKIVQTANSPPPIASW